MTPACRTHSGVERSALARQRLHSNNKGGAQTLIAVHRKDRNHVLMNRRSRTSVVADFLREYSLIQL